MARARRNCSRCSSPFRQRQCNAPGCARWWRRARSTTRCAGRPRMLIFLTDVPKLESAGILVRAPLAWGSGRPSRPMVKASIGERSPSLLGSAALLDFSMAVTLDGETLTAAELRALLKGNDGLQLIRGRWVEVDRNKLQRMMARFEGIEQA